MSAVLEAALGYARQGIYVLPIWWPEWEGGEVGAGAVSCACGTPNCISTGKHPIADLVPSGQHGSTVDETLIRSWFERYPSANIAIDLGPSGLFAFDVDLYHGDGEKLEALIRRLGPLPPTAEQISGSGEGEHIIWRRPQFPTRGVLGDITMRGRNYIVAAPSLHKSGNRYRWEVEGPIAELPATWLTALRRPDPLGDVGVPEQEPQWLRDIPAERRLADMRAHLEKEGGEIMGRSRPGLTRDIIKTAVRRHAVRDAVAAFNLVAEVYNPKCEPPYSDEELVNRLVFAYETAHTPEWGEAYEPQDVRVAALAAAIGYVIPPREVLPVSASSETRAYLQAAQRRLTNSRKGDRVLKGQILGAVLKGEPLPDAGDADAELLAFRTLIEVAPKEATSLELATFLVRSIQQPPDELARAIDLLRGHSGGVDQPEPENDEEVRAQLAMTENGPKASGANIELILRYSETTRGNILFDELTKTIRVEGVFEDEPEGCLDVGVKNWLERKWSILASTGEVGEQLQRVARKFGAYNPVANYLEPLVWDGVPRIDEWLITYCHAETRQGDHDITAYVRAVGSKWLIGAVARALDPGCKMDTVLVLEGEQGARKSTAFKVLGGQWFSDTPIVMGDKDSRMLASSQWICELAELASLAKSATEAQKAFLSSAEDKFRPPYGRAVVTSRRHCVFAGTVNPTPDGMVDYLQDETGDRRWWPVRCGADVELEALIHDRDQLWAEAVHRYKQGAGVPAESRAFEHRWWLWKNEYKELLADKVAESRHAENPWEATIYQWAERQVNGSGPVGNQTGRRDRWLLSDIMEGALGIEKDQHNRRQKEVSAALRKAGFVRSQEGQRRQRLWSHPQLSVPKIPEKPAPSPSPAPVSN